MDPTAYEIHELRCKFFDKLESEHGNTKGYFNPDDLTRINHSDHWLNRFLVHNDMDVNSALTMLWNTCEWRKENNIHDINEGTLNKEYLEDGIIFSHNRDKDGKILLILKGKKHVKGQRDFEELKRIAIYWFERAERKGKGNQITLFFDMTDAGLNNLDMEYIKFLINLFKSYYPDFLNYILIFEMPWILNAAFKIIKGWLPTKAVQKIKFVSKSNLKDFVDADQALMCWGGLDDYTYKFVPENGETASAKVEDIKKKVHFADGSPLVEVMPSLFNDVDIGNSSAPSSKLRVSPSESVLFRHEGSELTGNVNLVNTNEKTVTYKIKTTSPDKFRVRPSCGVLHPNNSTTVSVVLLPGHQPAAILRDKFLVMSFPLEDNLNSNTELVDLWKETDSKIVDQHRLRCILSEHVTTSSPNGATSLPARPSGDMEQKINQLLIGLNHLSHCNNQLEADIQFSNRMHLLTVFILLVIGGALIYLIQKLELFDLQLSSLPYYDSAPAEHVRDL